MPATPGQPQRVKHGLPRPVARPSSLKTQCCTAGVADIALALAGIGGNLDMGVSVCWGWTNGVIARFVRLSAFDRVPTLGKLGPAPLIGMDQMAGVCNQVQLFPFWQYWFPALFEKYKIDLYIKEQHPVNRKTKNSAPKLKQGTACRFISTYPSPKMEEIII
jgi:hypothetical protein